MQRNMRECPSTADCKHLCKYTSIRTLGCSTAQERQLYRTCKALHATLVRMTDKNLAGSSPLAMQRCARRARKCSGRGQQQVCTARSMSFQEAIALLGIRSDCSREELRAAYLARIKEVTTCAQLKAYDENSCRISIYVPQHSHILPCHSAACCNPQHQEWSIFKRGTLQVHPDVNPALNSTDDAVRLNEAYAVLQLVSLAPYIVCICQSLFWYGMGFLSI